MEILKLIPAYKNYLWGGNRLKEKYGKETDMTPLAESWELSCHEDGLSVIADGAYKGVSLKEYINANKKSLGTQNKTGELPMLLSALAERAGVSPAAVCSHDNVRVDVLGDGNRTMVVMIFNNSSETVRETVEMKGLSGTFEEIFTKQKFTAQDGHLFFEAESGDCLTLCRMDDSIKW